MKILNQQSVSSFLHYVSKFGYYYALFLLGIFAITLGIGMVSYWLEWENFLVSIWLEERFEMHIKPLDLYVKGGEGLSILIPLVVLSTMLFYVLVLYYFSKLSKVFRADVIFKKEVVHYLTKLAYSFLTAAVLSFGIMYFSPHSDSDFTLGVLLLFVVSPVLFFIRFVFEKGIFLQDEVNHTV